MKKYLKILGITVAAILALLIIIPFFIPKTINQEVTKFLNKNINGEVRFKDSNISFFTHFPSLTINLNEFLLKGAAPFQKDSLLYARRLSFGINLFSLFSKTVKIDEFYVDQANINILVDEHGNANYNVYKSSGKVPASSDTSSTAIKIEGLYFNNCNLVYNDKSIPFLLNMQHLNYQGNGNLSSDIFDLKSKLTVADIDLFYNHTPYLLNKKLDASLITKINTNSLELIFNENNLLINALPIEFKGRFAFLKDGYDLNFRTKSKETDLENIFSALPPSVIEKFKETEIKGYAEISASLIGKYSAATNEMPTATFNLKVRDGWISNPKVPVPISKLYLNFKSKLPGLNPDRLFIDMDSLYFNMGTDYVASVFKLDGLKNARVKTNTRSNIDLEKWSKVLSINELALKGRLSLDVQADGQFTKKIVRSGIRQIDTVLATVPKFSLKSSLDGGYLKFSSLPAAIQKINFKLEGFNTDGLYQHTRFDLKDLNLEALNNYIRGQASVVTAEDLQLNLQLKSLINFADLKKVYPVQGMELSGHLNLDVKSTGVYNQAKKHFPVTKAAILLEDGRIKTSYLPEALEQIRIDANLTNTDGTLKSSTLLIKPISFNLAGQPFELKANIKNFDNIQYDLSSKGLINIGKMYQFFAVKGYQVKGSIATNLHFKGSQRDAMAGHYAKLYNTGTLKVKHLNLQSDLFPKPFLIEKGDFSFLQDKMKFDAFQASYGQSDFKLNGAIRNVINYVLTKGAKLEGHFKLDSRKINADEFMVYAANPGTASAKASSGVILIPDNLNVSLEANAREVLYNGLSLKNAKGQMTINNGTIQLKQSGFTIIDAPVLMDAMYKSTSTRSGNFNFHLTAANFDIARAYKEIKLFREMASSASSVKGIVGLDYQLAGRLNADMFPVLPSLKGGGVLNLKQVSLMGFKMMNAVSKATSRDSLKNPDLKDVQVKSKIANNILTIEQTKMKIAGFRPRFEGQVSLDGKLNLSGRLGLPPFGILGIPLSITGTQEKPVVKLKRNKTGKLEETADGGR